MNEIVEVAEEDVVKEEPTVNEIAEVAEEEAVKEEPAVNEIVEEEVGSSVI